jgi:hypothetical protein
MMEEYRRQLGLVMMMMADIRPGSVCLDTSCPTGLIIPHMATDGLNHPHPYGMISTPRYEWRRKSWLRRIGHRA